MMMMKLKTNNVKGKNQSLFWAMAVSLTLFIVIVIVSVMIMMKFMKLNNNERDTIADGFSSSESVMTTTTTTLFIQNGLGDRILDTIGASVIRLLLSGIPIEIKTRNHQRNRDHYDPRLIDISALNVAWSRAVGDDDDDHHRTEIKQELVNDQPSVTLSPYNVHTFLGKYSAAATPTPRHYTYDEVINAYINMASRIQPSPVISKYIPEGLESHIGIHLRRTDKIVENPDASHEMTPVEYDVIITRLKLYVQEYISTQRPDETTYFYVLSDDEVYKDEFIQYLHTVGNDANRNIQVTTTSERDIPEHIRQTYAGAYPVLEFFALQRCKMIIQCAKYSTFSMAAALISQKPLVNFTDAFPEWLLLVWKPCLNLILTSSGTSYLHTLDIDEIAVASRNFTPRIVRL
jgi:hypothetical protein